jgi:peptidoglycan/LPS O-acetylase OafA/YrhL
LPESEPAPPAPRRLPPGRLPGGVSLALDAIRFVAALTVFASHMAWRFFTGAFLWPMEPYGAHAVVVFFVLSGFVIGHVAATSEPRWRQFAAARLARLWSVALPALALTFALDAIGRSIDPARYHALIQYVWTGRLHQALSGALFLNETWGLQTYVGTALPYWSLGYEAWYYAVFALAWYPRGAWRVLAVAAAVAAGPRIMVMAPLWALGLALYHTTARRPPPRTLALPLALAGLLLWGGWIALAGPLADIGVLGAWFDRPTLLQDYVVASAFALILLGIAAGTNAAGRALGKLAGPIRYLAGASFSLYLVHVPLMMFLLSVLPWPETDLRTRLALLVGVPLAALAFAHATERRKHAWRRVISRFFKDRSWPETDASLRWH